MCKTDFLFLNYYFWYISDLIVLKKVYFPYTLDNVEKVKILQHRITTNNYFSKRGINREFQSNYKTHTRSQLVAKATTGLPLK